MLNPDPRCVEMRHAVDTNQQIAAASGAFAGRALNAYQVESLRLEVIVALQAARELEPILRAYSMHRVFRLRSSAQAMSKPRDARRSARISRLPVMLCSS